MTLFFLNLSSEITHERRKSGGNRASVVAAATAAAQENLKPLGVKPPKYPSLVIGHFTPVGETPTITRLEIKLLRRLLERNMVVVTQ